MATEETSPPQVDVEDATADRSAGVSNVSAVVRGAEHLDIVVAERVEITTAAEVPVQLDAPQDARAVQTPPTDETERRASGDRVVPDEREAEGTAEDTDGEQDDDGRQPWVERLKSQIRAWPRALRITVGVLFVIGGLVGFLPVLGFWMVPLGLAILAVDLPPVKRAAEALERRWRRWRGDEEPDGESTHRSGSDDRPDVGAKTSSPPPN